MATPTPTGYTIDFVTTPTAALVDAQNNLLDPVRHYLYYMNDVNWNKIDLVSKVVLAANAPATDSPGGTEVLSVDPNGYIWYCRKDFGSPTHAAALKIDPSTFATLGNFDMANGSWNYKVQTYLGHTITPGLCTQWPTQDGKIVFCCTWSNSTPANAKPNPFVGAFNASTLGDLGTCELTLPIGTPGTYFLYQPPNGNYYVDTRSTLQIIPILDEAGHVYVLGKTTRQGTSVPIVYDWYVWKINLATMTATTWHFTGDITVGLGSSMIYDTASNSLLVQSTTGKLFVVDCATGTITNTVSGLFSNGNLGVIQTQGKTLNGVFFTVSNGGGGVVKDFVLVSGLTSEGTFVNTSGVNWGGNGAGFSWVYDPTLNCIVVPTGNNYPPGIGTHPATLIYELVAATATTTLTGNWQDLAGNPIANGTLQLRLTGDAKNPTGQTTAVTVIIPLDSGGNMTPTPVWSNSLLNAGTGVNTFYIGTVFTAGGQQVWKSRFSVPVSPNPYNVANIIPVPTM